MRHAEIALDPLFQIPSLLLADEQHLAIVEFREAGEDRVVVPERTIAVQLDELVEHQLDVILRLRALGCRATLTTSHGSSESNNSRLVREISSRKPRTCSWIRRMAFSRFRFQRGQPLFQLVHGFSNGSRNCG